MPHLTTALDPTGVTATPSATATPTASATATAADTAAEGARSVADFLLDMPLKKIGRAHV